MVKAKLSDKKNKSKSDSKKPIVKNVCSVKKSTSSFSSCCCCKCGEVIGDESKALQCERCTVEVWKCSSCLGFTDELYDVLTSSSKNCCNCLHWFCSRCEEYVLENLSVIGEKVADTLERFSEKTSQFEQHMIDNLGKIERQLVDRITAMEQLMEKRTGFDQSQWMMVEDRLKKLEEKPCIIEEAQQRIEQKVDQLKNNMKEPMVQVVQGALQGALQQDKAEEAEIENRKRNVIVHGVSESQADSPDQRVEDDLAILAAMFHEVGVEELKVDSVVRLGKKNTDDTQNVRPMKVVLDSVEGKINLLRSAKNLRLKQEGGWAKIFIH